MNKVEEETYFSMELWHKNKNLTIKILNISFPAIIEMSLNTLVGIIDTLMISYIIGKEGLSAAGYANQIIFSLIFIFTSFNAGATAMISRYFGEKNYPRLNKVFGMNISLNISIAILATFFSFVLAEQVMSIFDMEQEVLEMSISYFKIVSLGQIFLFFSFAAAASLRGVSDTKTPMIITGIANLINIVGNYVLMTGFAFFPNLGMDGAAVATTISRVIAALLYLKILLKGRNHLQLSIKNLQLESKIFKTLWNLSYTAGLEQIFMQFSFLASGLFVSYLDTTAEATYRILLNIESLALMPAIGLGIAASALVGRALGEKDKEKAFKTGYISGVLGVSCGILIGSLFLIFPELTVRIFSNDINIIEYAKSSLLYVAIDQPFLAFVVIISSTLRGAGDTRTVMILNALRQWAGVIPLCYWLIMYTNTGVKSVWLSEIIVFSIFCIILFKRFKKGKWVNIKI